MARARSPNRDKALDIYIKSRGKLKPKQIAEMLSKTETKPVKDSLVRKWKSQDKWDEVLKGELSLPNSNDIYNPNSKKHPEKARWGNKSSLGYGAPKGNLNNIKHGAYQSLYIDRLSPEEQELYEKASPEPTFDEEIKLLRLKIARLLNREKTIFYDMFGKRREKIVSEEDRETGILACMDQLRRLIESKANISGDTEKLVMDREKLEFNKYKAEVELKLKQEKMEIEKNKNINNDDKPIEILIKRKGVE
ncbi:MULTISPECIES: phage terminase small subunit [Clostridium]|uniref:Phage terminase, small subunit n=1 Tax=Clostridium novyi B str. ATCC 27606 TaxID=1443123 RepID=A0AA40M466_CLONO|nr:MULTISPECIES: phage terminase small subunit [Clostridium]KEH96164.1 phage terminase, small subunit [Clostridium botulinum D str. 16868]KEI08154.1 phage terminase, small subunit [Clostridium novyi B str. NCTC 9691]KEI11493.1 phage terminase, small subunit [Clostridium novyi B str. ATCC 27606]KLU74262.1 phage-like terminase small subunit yqas [Clostridium botulinum V891]MCD3202876.1 terminase [Clostridium botulinum C/D]